MQIKWAKWCVQDHSISCFVVIQYLSHVWKLWSHGLQLPGFSVLHYLPEFVPTQVQLILIQWYYPTISSSVTHFSCPQSFLASGSLTVRQLFISVGQSIGVSLVAQMVKHLPAMPETWVQSLGQEDPLEKEMATHSSTLAWKIPWREEPGRLQSMESQRVWHDWVTSLLLTSWSFSFSISLSNEYSGLISFETDRFDLLAVRGTLKSLL